MARKKYTAPALAFGAIGVVGASVISLGATGTLGAFTAIIENRDNVITGSTVEFSQVEVEGFSVNAPQIAGSEIRTSEDGGIYNTPLAGPLFPVLTTANQGPAVGYFVLENTGTTNATVSMDIVYRDELTRGGVPEDPTKVNAAELLNLVDLNVRAAIEDAWSNPAASSEWAPTTIGASGPDAYASFDDRDGGTPAAESALVIGPRQKVIVETSMSVNAAGLDALGKSNPLYSGLEAMVDVNFQMTPTLAEKTLP